MSNVPESFQPAASPSVSAEWLVYKFAANGGVVFQTAEQALYDEAVNGALAEATTWGEFRRLLPEGEWGELLPLLCDAYPSREDEEDEEAEETVDWASDDASFSPDAIPGFGDGDYPRWAQQEIEDVLPGDLLALCGRQKDSVHNGKFWLIPHRHVEPLVAALRDRGYHVEEAQFLRGW